MLKLESDFKCSKVEFLIGGVNFFVYNSDSLAAYVKKAISEGSATTSDLVVNVLYLVHQREGDYTYTEGIGKMILEEFTDSNTSPLIAVTFDGRNHGARTIDASKNLSWEEGTNTHGIDMLSCIKGIEYDLKLCIDFLPACLNLERFFPPMSGEPEYKVTYNNILSGYSVGGHSIIRFANNYPELVSVINPNIGCCELSTLLINRLKKTNDFSKKYCYYRYDELGLTDIQAMKYPQSLHELTCGEDIKIYDDFQFETIDMFASFFTDDPVVPSKISELWIKMYLNSNLLSEVHYETGDVHDITPLMITKFAKWLSKRLL